MKEPDTRISQIQTRWSLVARAHGSDEDLQRARAELLDCYAAAVQRYLIGALRSEEAANEVFQEFSLRVIRGDFRGAEPDQGRFRSYLKTCLHHLMMDYHRQIQRKPRSFVDNPSAIIAPLSQTDTNLDRSFVDSWRRGLLDETWHRLRLLSQRSGNPYYAVLRARADHPDATLKQLATHLQTEDIDFEADTKLRVTLHRARKRFAALLIDQIRETLTDPTEQAIDEELIELGLRHLVR